MLREPSPCRRGIPGGMAETGVERLDPPGKKSVRVLYRVDMEEAEDIRELTLQGLPQSLDAPFSLRGQSEYDLDVQLVHKVIKMRALIFGIIQALR